VRHEILRRQLRQSGVTHETAPPTPEAWRALLDKVSLCYTAADQDRYTLQRALDISSREMQQLNQDLERRVAQRTEDLGRANAELQANFSKLREAQAQLLQAQKMEAVGRLAGGVAHDFNNLLGAIMSFASLARDSVREDSTARDDLDEILAATNRASDLTRQLLLFSRRDEGLAKVVQLNSRIMDLDKILRRTLGADIELVFLPEPHLWRTEIDLTHLDQLVMNLVVNARDALPAGGTITIQTANAVVAPSDDQARKVPPGEYVLLVVEDDGIGMSESVQEHMFEPFFTTKGVGRGTGLGLATCYAVVQGAGGVSTVRSALGQGTAFAIYLPRARQEHVALGPARDSVPACSGTERILLVEDEPALRKAASRALQKRGYVVIEAEHGEAALARLEQVAFRIDLVVTDIVMPKMGGHELSTRCEELMPGLRFLFMSGYASDRVAPSSHGRDGAVLQKPFMPDELAQRVREILDQPAPARNVAAQ
jgi:two-component system cell cycle sensor histidine kinase/response regulator CckA